VRLFWYASPYDYARYILNDSSLADTLENRTYKVDITGNLDFGVTLLDTDNDTLIDQVQWITPHLSNQTFEISITVLNPLHLS